jgi:hypothetical protein
VFSTAALLICTLLQGKNAGLEKPPKSGKAKGGKKTKKGKRTAILPTSDFVAVTTAGALLGACGAE